MSRRRKRGLSSDDLEVWRNVTKSLTPLTPGPIENPGADASSNTPDPSPAVAPKKPVFRAVQLRRPATAIPEPRVSIDVAPDPVAALRSAKSNLDRRNYDRLRKGKFAPERRIDLHGMTVATAQAALTRFVFSAYSDELRVVLIITGKGRTGPVDDGVIPRRRGVIRQSVPHWLKSPPLGDMVVQTLPAADRHGGSGAFYVYLKRRR